MILSERKYVWIFLVFCLIFINYSFVAAQDEDKEETDKKVAPVPTREDVDSGVASDREVPKTQQSSTWRLMILKFSSDPAHPKIGDEVTTSLYTAVERAKRKPENNFFSLRKITESKDIRMKESVSNLKFPLTENKESRERVAAIGKRYGVDFIVTGYIEFGKNSRDFTVKCEVVYEEDGRIILSFSHTEPYDDRYRKAIDAISDKLINKLITRIRHLKPKNKKLVKEKKERAYAVSGCWEVGGYAAGPLNMRRIDESDGAVDVSRDAINLFIFRPYVGYFPWDNFEVILSPELLINTEWKDDNRYGLTLAPGYVLTVNDTTFLYLYIRLGFTMVNTHYNEANNSYGIGGHDVLWRLGNQLGVKFELGGGLLMDLSIVFDFTTRKPLENVFSGYPIFNYGVSAFF